MGMWDDVIDANRRAIDVVNKQREARGKARADCGHYPLWLHYGYLQQHRNDDATQALEACRQSALVVPFVAAGPVDTRRDRIEAYAEMRAHHLAAGLPLAGDDAAAIPAGAEMDAARFLVAYGDLLAAWRGGNAETLGRARGRLTALKESVLAEIAAKGSANPAARMKVEVMLQEAEALQLVAAGKRAEALAILQKVAEGERAMPLEFGPPVLAKPAVELLAEQLVAAGRPAEAVSAYRASLARTPGRAASVEGLGKVAGSAAPAKQVETEAAGHVH